MKTEELVKALRNHCDWLADCDWPATAKDIASAANTIERQSATIKALTEALSDLLEFTEGEHVKPYNGQESVCHHPNCGESGGHLPWCPIGVARTAVAQAREEE